MQGNHALPSELGSTPRLGVEMILSLATHHDFAVLGYPETLCE